MKLMLRAKFLIPIVSIIFVCIALLGYQSYRTSAQLLETKIQSNLEQISSLIAQQAKQWVNSVDAIVSTQGTRDSILNFLKSSDRSAKEVDRINVILATTIKPYADFDGLSLCNAEGKAIASSTPDVVGLDISGREYFKECQKTGNNVISNTIISKRDGTSVFVCTSQIKAEGKILGYVMAILKCKDFSEGTIAPIKIGENGYAFIADKAGMVFAHPNSNLIMKTNINDYDWGKIITAKKNGFLYYTFNGQNKMLAYNTDKLSGWSVAVCASIDDINNEVLIVRNTAIIAGLLVAILLSIVLTVLLTKLVTNPLSIIMDFIERTSVGDTSSNAKFASQILNMYKRKDEIGNITRSAGGLRKYVNQKAKEAQDIANGDFTAKIVIASDKDNLGKSFTEMKERLNHTLASVSTLVEQVTNGSNQFEAASQSLSAGATETAASLEEINSSILQIGSQTKLNAENAGEANALANESKTTADKGNADVEQMVVAMVDMQESGQQIAKIVKMIDDIAFQTNLLSLNAAVEAARAGQHGKGFAVVAEEVRNLAGRSAKAAQETAELVEQTVNKLSNGAKIANNTQESLVKVVDDVVKVVDILGEIAISSNEQAEGISQISTGLQQIEHVTQNNTSNAEETSSAAITMASQAQQLNKLMSQFKLESSESSKNMNSSMTTKNTKPTNHRISNTIDPKMIELDD